VLKILPHNYRHVIGSLHTKPVPLITVKQQSFDRHVQRPIGYIYALGLHGMFNWIDLSVSQN